MKILALTVCNWNYVQAFWNMFGCIPMSLEDVWMKILANGFAIGIVFKLFGTCLDGFLSLWNMLDEDIGPDGFAIGIVFKLFGTCLDVFQSLWKMFG